MVVQEGSGWGVVLGKEQEYNRYDEIQASQVSLEHDVKINIEVGLLVDRKGEKEGLLKAVTIEYVLGPLRGLKVKKTP